MRGGLCLTASSSCCCCSGDIRNCCCCCCCCCAMPAAADPAGAFRTPVTADCAARRAFVVAAVEAEAWVSSTAARAVLRHKVLLALSEEPSTGYLWALEAVNSCLERPWPLWQHWTRTHLDRSLSKFRGHWSDCFTIRQGCICGGASACYMAEEGALQLPSSCCCHMWLYKQWHNILAGTECYSHHGMTWGRC